MILSRPVQKGESSLDPPFVFAPSLAPSFTASFAPFPFSGFHITRDEEDELEGEEDDDDDDDDEKEGKEKVFVDFLRLFFFSMVTFAGRRQLNFVSQNS